MFSSKKYIFIFVIFAVLASFAMGFFVGQERIIFSKSGKVLINKEVGQPDKVDFSLFWDVWNIIEKKYAYRPVDPQTMVYGAIDGMIHSLDDPYSLFMTPEETKQFSEDISGSFEGVGMEIGIKDNVLTVIAPLEDTPAQRAGIKAGDKILKVNDTTVADLSLDEAVRLIRGPRGTEVKLTIIRDGLEKTKEISVIRDVINIKSIEWEMITLDKNKSRKKEIVHLKIHQFNEDTAQELDEAVDKILAADPYGIILDLRNNPGGYLETSVEIAGFFIPKGEIVAIEDFGNGRKQEYKTKNKPRLEKFPLVVIVNEGSASASEILAGALRDIKKVKLVGKKTFGKGSVQELKRLKDNSGVRLTIAKWLTPNGVCINKEGLHPDIEAEMNQEDFEAGRDPQLDEAIKILE